MLKKFGHHLRMDLKFMRGFKINFTTSHDNHSQKLLHYIATWMGLVQTECIKPLVNTIFTDSSAKLYLCTKYFIPDFCSSFRDDFLVLFVWPFCFWFSYSKMLCLSKKPWKTLFKFVYIRANIWLTVIIFDEWVLISP